MSEKIYYTLPFRAERLIGKSPSDTFGYSEATQPHILEKSALKESVRQNIRLLLITPPLRVRFDPFYGCIVHWQQFLAGNRAMESKREEDNFKHKMEENIKSLIEKFEPRVELREVIVTIKYAIEDHFEWKLSAEQRTLNNVLQLIVRITGTIKGEYAHGQSLELEDTIPLL
jgi:predicted component of type VI protein secretion system